MHNMEGLQQVETPIVVLLRMDHLQPEALQLPVAIVINYNK